MGAAKKMRVAIVCPASNSPLCPLRYCPSCSHFSVIGNPTTNKKLNPFFICIKYHLCRYQENKADANQVCNDIGTGRGDFKQL